MLLLHSCRGFCFGKTYQAWPRLPIRPASQKRCPRPFSPLRQFTFVFVPPSSLTVCKPLTARAAISLSNGLEAAAPYLPAGGLFLYMCVSYSTHLVCISGGWREGCLLYPYRVGGVWHSDKKKMLNFMGWDINCFGGMSKNAWRGLLEKWIRAIGFV